VKKAGKRGDPEFADLYEYYISYLKVCGIVKECPVSQWVLIMTFMSAPAAFNVPEVAVFFKALSTFNDEDKVEFDMTVCLNVVNKLSGGTGKMPQNDDKVTQALFVDFLEFSVYSPENNRFSISLVHAIAEGEGTLEKIGEPESGTFINQVRLKQVDY